MSFASLINRTTRLARTIEFEAYFDGRHRLDALGVSLPPEMRVLEMVVDWPRIAVESLDERLTVEGFSLTGDPSTDARCWNWWQANNLDVNSSLLHIESFVQGNGFALVGPGDGDTPRITIHRNIGIVTETDPLTGLVREALVRYKQADDSRWAAYYVAGTTEYYASVGGVWKLAETRASGMDVVPVVPFTNRARIGDRSGRSEMVDVMSYTDACSRTITNLQVATELMAMPQRYLMGGKGGTTFADQNGKPIPQWEVYIGRLLTGPAGATAGQFSGANLDQIINVVKLYGQMVSASTGMPMSYLGIATDNPPSAEALNAAANRHVKKAEKKQVQFGESWEQVMRACMALVDGKSNPALVNLETRWRDASTPTLASKAAAATALVTANIIPPVVARDMIGLTPEQKKLADDWEKNSPMKALAKAVGANEPQPIPISA